MPWTKSKDGTRIYFEICGKSEAILLSHAWTQSSKNWAEIKDLLSKTNTVILWDQRGHGKSGLSKTIFFKPESFAEDLKAVIDAVGFKKFVAVGHSMGGIATLKFYEKYPEMLRAIVLLNTPYKSPILSSSLWNGSYYFFKYLSLLDGCLYIFNL